MSKFQHAHNVDIKTTIDDKLVITIDLSHPPKNSQTGKTKVIASAQQSFILGKYNLKLHLTTK